MAPFADSFGPQFRELWLQVVDRTLERAGPAFIKWGQWAATRPDLFPRDLCNKLSKLHTKAPEHSFAYTKKAIEKAFGRKISEIFSDFEVEPVASGSIAQIHRAFLQFRYPGRLTKPLLVAVKDVKESFDFWGTPEEDLVHPDECMLQVLGQVRRHKVNVDGNVCAVMVTILVLEGWQRKLDPDYDVIHMMHTLQPLLLKADWAKSLSYTIEGLVAP